MKAGIDKGKSRDFGTPQSFDRLLPLRQRYFNFLEFVALERFE